MGGNGGVQVCVYLFQCPHLSLRHTELNGSNDSTSRDNGSEPDFESLNGILGEGLAVWRYQVNTICVKETFPRYFFSFY